MLEHASPIPLPPTGHTAPTNPTRDVIELCVGYALILATIWTPRPAQHWLYWAAFLWIVVSTWISFPGWATMGFRLKGFWDSLWLVGVAVLLTSTTWAVADRLHTLHHPNGILGWFHSFGGYTVWAFMQQFLLQGYFLLRLLRILPNPRWAAVAAAAIFAGAHLPNPILTATTLLWGLCACLVFLRARNLYALAIAHALFGICISVSVPGPAVHNMRVGRGYLVYRAPLVHTAQVPPESPPGTYAGQ